MYRPAKWLLLRFGADHDAVAMKRTGTRIRIPIECGALCMGQTKMRSYKTYTWILTTILALCAGLSGQQPSAKRKIIIDQDAAGPAGTDQQSILLFVQSPHTEVLGITVVTGDAWLKDEVAHTLRMLELIGRTDIPVVPGAEYPLVRRKEETELWEQQYGVVPWTGAWTPRMYHPHDQLGAMPEGAPTTRPLDEDAAHFMVRMVRKYPHEVTIYAGGPMTNLALAMALEPDFPAWQRNSSSWVGV